jgi:hypothetical protein
MEQQAEHSPGRAALLTRRSDILRQVRSYSASADLDQNRTFKKVHPERIGNAGLPQGSCREMPRRVLH